MRKLLTLNKDGKLSLRAADGTETAVRSSPRNVLLLIERLGAWREQRLSKRGVVQPTLLTQQSRGRMPLHLPSLPTALRWSATRQRTPTASQRRFLLSMSASSVEQLTLLRVLYWPESSENLQRSSLLQTARAMTTTPRFRLLRR